MYKIKAGLACEQHGLCPLVGELVLKFLHANKNFADLFLVLYINLSADICQLRPYYLYGTMEVYIDILGGLSNICDFLFILKVTST